MIGPTLTQQCNAIAPLVQANGPADFCLSPGLNPPANGYIWSSSVSLKDAIAATIRYSANADSRALPSSHPPTRRAKRRIAIGSSRAPRRNRGVDFVVKEHFNLSDVSVSAQMARIKAANPQALLTWTVGPAFGTELHGIADAGLDIPIFAATATWSLSSSRNTNRLRRKN